MLGRITASALILLAACSGGSLIRTRPKNTLNYSQYHSLEQGMLAQSILKAFGEPFDTLEQDGKIRGVTYYCENSAGQPTQLRMIFDEDERLREWALATPRKSPPGEQDSPKKDKKPES